MSDFTIHNNGYGDVVVSPQTDTARVWLHEYLYGGQPGVDIESEEVVELLLGIEAAGLSVSLEA